MATFDYTRLPGHGRFPEKRMEKANQSDYHAYLLRMWRDERDGPWRTTLVNPHSGEQLNFASLEQMWAFLQTLLREEKEEVRGKTEDGRRKMGGE